jgi:hypothetical protein
MIRDEVDDQDLIIPVVYHRVIFRMRENELIVSHLLTSSLVVQWLVWECFENKTAAQLFPDSIATHCTYKEEMCMQVSSLVKVTLIYLSNSCRKGRVLFCHDNDGAFKGLLGDWVFISFCTYLLEQGCRMCYMSFWQDFPVLGSVVGFNLHYSLGFMG